MAQYLMQAPGSTMLGLYYLPMVTLADELGYDTPACAREVLRRLEDKGFCRYDDRAREVFVVNMAAEQIGQTLKPRDKRVVYIERELAKYIKSPFYNDFLARYREPFCLRMMYVAREVELPDDLRDPSPLEGACMPPRSQDQDQDQDQEQESKTRGSARAAWEGEEGKRAERDLKPDNTNHEPPPYSPPPPQLELVRDASPPEAEREPGEPEPRRDWRTLQELVRTRFHARFEAARGGPPGWSRSNLAHVDAIADWLSKKRGDPERMLETLLKGFFADGWATAKGFPLGALAGDPTRYFSPPVGAVPSDKKPRGFMPPAPPGSFKPTDLNALFGLGGAPPCRT